MQEVRAEDLDAHIILNWQKKSMLRPSQTLKMLKKSRRNNLMQSTSRLLFKIWVYNSRKDTRQGGKLEWNWNGPCKIVEQTSRGTYRLQNEQGKLLKQAVSSNRLKLYIEPENRSEEQEEGEEKQTKGGKTQKNQKDRKRVRM